MFRIAPPSTSESGVDSPTRGRKGWRLLVILGALALVAAACGDDDASDEVPVVGTVAAATTTTAALPQHGRAEHTTAAPATTTTAAALETPGPDDVTETYEIPGFGFSIDYPAGWFVETRDSITVIAQTEEQLRSRFIDPRPPSVALGIGLGHRTLAFLQSIGFLVADPTAQDLLEFNTGNFDWTILDDLGEVDLFGTTTAAVRVIEPDDGFVLEYQGIRPDTDEIFLFGFGAPTEEILPAWEVIFNSITPTE